MSVDNARHSIVKWFVSPSTWRFWRQSAHVFTTVSIIVTLIVSVLTLRTTIDQNRRQNVLTAQGQTAERFGKSIEQLNSSSLGVRLGGIYALQSIARDSTDNEYDQDVGAVLYAFVDERSSSPPACPMRQGQVDERFGWGYGKRQMAQDVELAIHVLASIPYRSSQVVPRSSAHGVFNDENYRKLQFDMKAYADRGNLISVNWSPPKCWGEIELEGLDVSNWNVQGSDFSFGSFDGSTLAGTIFDGAKLNNARLRESNLHGAWLIGIDAFGADFTDSDMSNAHLAKANLCGADLTGADLRGAYLNNAAFGPATLRGATLNGADFSGTDLRGVDLSEVTFDAGTVWPDGFERPRQNQRQSKGLNCPPQLNW